jgi:uncharacterized membrane protein
MSRLDLLIGVLLGVAAVILAFIGPYWLTGLVVLGIVVYAGVHIVAGEARRG